MTQHQHHSDELKWRMEGNAGQVADILMEFAQEFRNGEVTVWKGKRELHLDPTGRVEFVVDAIADDDGKEGLHIKLHWTGRRSDQNALSGGAAPSGEAPR